MVTHDARHDFAVRFNEALDDAGVPPKNKGRQVAVGAMFGVTQNGARKWLEGESMPNTKRIPEMARQLGVRSEWLLAGEGPKRSRTVEGSGAAQLPSLSLEVTPEPSLSALLDALSARLEQADPAVRDEVMRLVLRYMEHPQSGARIVRAIEELLGSEHDHSPA